MKRLLIIKHGSLGDIVFALPVIHSIVHKYFKDNIDIITEKKYLSFLKRANYFKNIIEDNQIK